MDDLKPTMLRKDANTSPKLWAKAAEARLLVPFVQEHSERMLCDSDVECTIKAAAHQLRSCYECLAHDHYDHDVLAIHCRRFCLLYVALAVRFSPEAWKIKPKLHLMQGLCEMSRVCPSLTWTYRDEDFGGSLAGFVRRRGGSSGPETTSRNMLSKFVARHRVMHVVAA